MKKVLLVEDDPSIGEIVTLILTGEGYSVRLHTTGLSVPELVKEYDPNLVLLDIGLPGKSGTTICNELKEISNHPPVVLFSAQTNMVSSNRLCKADGCIGKPFDIKSFVETVHSYLN
ncbi:MAG: response regulator [Ginsengibacter sp.]